MKRLLNIFFLLFFISNFSFAEENKDTKTPIEKIITATEQDFVHLAKEALAEDSTIIDRWCGEHPQETPLMLALSNGSFQVAKFLIKEGADITKKPGDNFPKEWTKDWSGETCSMIFSAMHYDHVYTPYYHEPEKLRFDIIKYLSNHLDINEKCNGITPLMYAIKKRHEKVALGLAYKSSLKDLNVGDNNNMTPLMYAANYSDKNLVEYLLKRGVYTHETTNNGKTALDFAQESWNTMYELSNENPMMCIYQVDIYHAIKKAMREQPLQGDRVLKRASIKIKPRKVN